MDPVTGSLIGGALSGLNSAAGPAYADGGAYGSPVNVGGLTVNKASVEDFIVAGLIGAAVVWLMK